MEGSLLPFIVFKALLGFGLPIAFGVQQLVVTRRAIRADRAAAARLAAAAPRSEEPAVAVAEAPRRERELEPV